MPVAMAVLRRSDAQHLVIRFLFEIGNAVLGRDR
jgi:hypothetical protein